MTLAITAKRIRRSLEGCRPKFSLGLCLFEEGYDLDLFGFLIAIPILDHWHREPHELMERWGFYYHEAGLWLCWGDATKCIHMPWEFRHVKCEVRRPDGSWVPYVACYERDKEPDGRWQGSYPYRYTLRSGEIQERTATVYVERREWRQRWLKWCPLFAKVRTSIDVAFDGEVGERTGSWKGGTIGCGWDLRKNETPEQALRRMESERKFR